MTDPKKIIEELEILNNICEIAIENLDDVINSLSYPELKHYLVSFKVGTKPEHASQELLKNIADDVLDKEGFSEVKVKGGFVDFAIQEHIVNPILIELKPGFEKIINADGNVLLIRAKPLDFTRHKEQVQKYLTSNDFVILTNLKTSFLFNRDSIINFKPFYETTFPDLLRMFLDHDSLWDTVRRLEDQYVKPELEYHFFSDLNRWYNELDQINFIESNEFKKSELIVLFINKIIFAKTLEDFGLIPYKFISDEYFHKYEKWGAKGIFKILDNFFTEFEDWFWDYYDTDLFRTKIWDYINKDEKNLIKFERTFEKVLGVGKWEYTFGKGMVHYNYRKIDEDVFGKAYETFIAQRRKDSGIFYTHKLITKYMSERLVGELFGPIISEIIKDLGSFNYNSAQEKLDVVYKIKIADTTSGSGSFLIKVFREIFYYYQQIIDKLSWVNQVHDLFNVPEQVTKAHEFIDKNHLNNKRKLISQIIIRHIYAIDIDERAIEIAKTNLWKEAVKVEKGLFNFHKLGINNSHILPNLQLNFITADAIFDMPIEHQLKLLLEYFTDDIRTLHLIRDQYITDHTKPEVLEKAKQIKFKIRSFLESNLEILTRPTLVCLEFFYLFFDTDGNLLPETELGFSGIISNPPWEEIYPVKKEFAEIGKYEMPKVDFDKEFERRMKIDIEFAKEWQEYCLFYDSYAKFVSENYSHHKLKPPNSVAMRTHLNYFKLLFERNLQLIKADGFLNILIPSSFQTDEGCYGIRKLSLISNKLIELFSFENRGFKENINDRNKTKIFPDVHPQFKFSIVNVQKKQSIKNQSFKGLFYLHNPIDLYEKNPLDLNLSKIQSFSPHNLSIMEFGSEEDYNLCVKILGHHKVLEDFQFNFRREFHVSDDANIILRNRNNDDDYPVYQGKNIHQFTNIFTPISCYINKQLAHKDLLEKEVKRIKSDLSLKVKTKQVLEYFLKSNYRLDYQTYRLVYRAIGSSTNERTLICTIIPPFSFAVHSLNYLINCHYSPVKDYFIQTCVKNEDLLYVMSLMNSLTINYYIRNKISANLTMNYIYELPIPSVDAKTMMKIVNLSFSLLYSQGKSDDFNDLMKDLKIDIPSDIDVVKTRAELEVIISKELFALDKQDWLYLTSTFTSGENSETKKELDKIISESIQRY